MSAEGDGEKVNYTSEDELNKTVRLSQVHSGFCHDEVIMEGSAARRRGSIILHSHSFERGIGLIIAFNFMVVIVETDYNAMEQDLPSWCFWASQGLLVTFVIELILKLFVLRRKFWHDRWNVFDFTVIGVDLLMTGLEAVGAEIINVSMLRVLRLSRLARATKVLRVFPELRLMLAGLAGAMQAIFWGSVLLCVALLVWSVLAVQFIHNLNKKVAEKGYYNDCDRCPHAYESTFQAALTFFTQIVSGDSWGRETVPVIEEYPQTAIFFLSVFVSIGLAILNLILGVVVNVATEARDGLLNEMAEERTMARMESHNNLLKMCQEMDADGNDELTFDEIRRGYETNDEFRGTLKEMEIGGEDLQIVWTILDSDRSGTVTSKEFVSQVYKMKSSDTQFMLAYIKFYITEIKDKLRQDLRMLGSRIDTDMAMVEKLEEEIQEEVVEVAQCTQNIEKDMEMLVQDVESLAHLNGGSPQKQIESPVQVNGGSPQKLQKPQKVVFDDAVSASKLCKSRDIINDNFTPTTLRETTGMNQSDNGFFSPQDRCLAALDRCDDTIESLLQGDSLEALVEKVYVLDFDDDEPKINTISHPREPTEMLQNLEGVWVQCLESIDAMRARHSTMACLLETMIDRVSNSISHTVSASVRLKVAKQRRFSGTYNLLTKNDSTQASM